MSAEIDAFWSWWAERRGFLLENLHDAESVWVEELSSRVEALGEGLEWEFGPGVDTPHALAVTGAGNPKLRPLLERWRSAAPTDSEFTFHCSRQAGAGGLTIRLPDGELSFDEIRFGVTFDDPRRRYDVVLHHPFFATLPEDRAQWLSFLVLDNLLGEDAVETWVGKIDTSAAEIEEFWDTPRLQREVADSTARWPNDAGLTLLEARRPDGVPLSIMAQLGRKYLDYPFHDTLVQVVFHTGGERNGFPAHEELDELNALYDRLTAGDVLDLCRVTGDHRQVLYLYVTAANGPERQQIETLSAEWPRGAELATSWDPGWRELPV